MIQLTRLNGAPLTVNSDLIKFVEQSPDTVITLLSGEKIVVGENAGQVVERIVQFRQAVLEGIDSTGGRLRAVTVMAGGRESPVAELDER